MNVEHELHVLMDEMKRLGSKSKYILLLIITNIYLNTETFCTTVLTVWGRTSTGDSTVNDHILVLCFFNSS